MLNRLDEVYHRITKVLETSREPRAAWGAQQFGHVLHMRGQHKRELLNQPRDTRLRNSSRNELTGGTYRRATWRLLANRDVSPQGPREWQLLRLGRTSFRDSAVREAELQSV